MKPPLALRALMQACAPTYIAGDLLEEYCHRAIIDGRSRASRWYLRQAILSLPALLNMRLRRQDLPDMLASSMAAITLPLLAFDRLWAYIYTQIPLRGGTERAPELLLLNLVCVVLLAWFSRARANFVSAACCGGCALVFSIAYAPWWYALCVLLAVPATTALGGLRR